MYRCAVCRTAFVWPQPTPEYLEQFYSRFHLTLDKGGGYEQMEQRMQSDFPAKVAMARRASNEVAKPRLLDVGCGKGFFVRAASDAGFDATGIDLSDTAIRFAREQLHVNAKCGWLEDLSESLGQFDIVTFWATIEHVPDPVATLRAIHAVLKPAGHLLLDTGIGDDWLDRMLPGVAQWYDPPQHLWVFSQEGMRRALQSAGFGEVKIDPCFERSPLRKFIRIVRAGVVASSLRIVCELGRLSVTPFEYRRYPLGNLMSVVARRSG
jgi:SAM-dependent methyltransferase